jgi:hypothetical protein
MNCMDCKNHVVVADPDPTDWFCDDDQAVLCGVTPRGETDNNRWRDNKPFPFRVITTSCRPHQKRKECEAPKWCPLEAK